MTKPLGVLSSLVFISVKKKKKFNSANFSAHTLRYSLTEESEADCGGDGGYWACSSRRVRCTECGCGYSFLRILNAEPVPVAPRLTIGSWPVAPLLHGYCSSVHFFFVIYFLPSYLFLYICPFLLYTLVCAITSYFPFISFWSWTCIQYASVVGLVQSRLACIVPDIASCDTQPKFYFLSITHLLSAVRYL